MNHGVYSSTGSSIKTCLPFWMKSVYEHLEKNKQVFPTDFVKSLICMMMKKYKHI
jgi:hypothetical protein